MRASSLATVRSKVRASVEERGVLGTVRAGSVLLVKRRWWALQELYFDLTHGVRTRGHVVHDDRVGEDAAYAHARRYQGIGVRAFRDCLAALEVEERDFVFIDIGCGKGRALALAAEHPFRSIIGVELAPELARDAERNVERLRRKGRSLPPIEVVRADATAYSFPREPLVVFLYNPFDETLMTQVIEHVGSCLEASRLPAFVIYSTPVHREVTDAAPFLELRRDLGHSAIYASRPPVERT